ncbi:MAG: hypothetical protein U9Q05_00290, partial [Thermodesulfobacteriota bacterium]|nr:hypothetical protein [Thermodesulfobacteriota bacterium]
APLIMNRNINNDLDFIKEVKGMVVLKASPVHIDKSRLDQINVKAHRLVSSSDKSWEMKAPINLNPMMMSPPPNNEKRDQFPLAYLLEGKFPSYFEGKTIPVKTVQESSDQETATPEKDKALKEEDISKKEAQTKKSELTDVERSGTFIARGKPAKIFVMAASDMITDTILDREGRSPNAMFIMNMIDALNDREEIAVMRSKTQQLNPLNAPSAGFKTIIKAFNIIGLPILVVIFGLLVWMRRHARKKRIQMIFQTE